jgi:hypothetical protein
VRPSTAQAGGPLVTGVADDKAVADGNAGLAFARMRAAGATTVRLTLNWAAVASRAPADPANPADPAYQWGYFDRQVQLARATGLAPSALVLVAPAWAERGGGYTGFTNPDPGALGAFALAAARRYDGRTPGLPRVRDWEAWNEPNAAYFLRPQFSGATAVSPALYRRMLRAFSDGVRLARPDNVVVAGNTFPFAIDGQAVAPLTFLRQVLCLEAGPDPAGCDPPLRFDVWAHHPYTNGGPSIRSSSPGNVSLGNLPELRSLLEQARRRGRIVTGRGRVRLWVEEFSWDSNPPDPAGVQASVLRRWVPEAMATAWRAGAERFTWFLLRDEPTGSSQFQSGLYSRCEQGIACDTPKPLLTGFRFPFALRRDGRKAALWGRTPAGRRTRVIIEQLTSRGWRVRAKVKTDRYGIFRVRLKRAGKGDLRARLAATRTKSPAFPAQDPPTVPATAFGS